MPYSLKYVFQSHILWDAKFQQGKCHAQVLLLHDKCQESLFLTIFCNTDAEGLEIL